MTAIIGENRRTCGVDEDTVRTIGRVEANSYPQLRRIKTKIKNIIDTVQCVRVFCKRVVVVISMVCTINESRPLIRRDDRGAIRNRDFFYA